MRKIIFLLLIFAMCTLTACANDAKEIDDQAYILNMGIDHGTLERLRMTVQMPSIVGVGGGDKPEGDDTPGYVIVEVEGDSLAGCFDMLNNKIPRHVSLLNVTQIILSEEVALSDYFSTLVYDIAHWNSLRQTSLLVIAKDSAGDLVKKQEPYIGVRLSKSMAAMIDSYTHNSVVPNSVFLSFYGDFASGSGNGVAMYAALNADKSLDDPAQSPSQSEQLGDYYPGDLPSKSNYQPEYFGSAIFGKDRLALLLTGYETQLLSILHKHFSSAIVQVMMEEQPIQIFLRSYKNTKVRVDLSGEVPSIDLWVSLEGSTVQSLSAEQEMVLTIETQRMLTEDMAKLIATFQSKKVDPASFADKARVQFSTFPEWQAYDWLERFADAKVQIDVRCILRAQNAASKNAR